MANAKKSKQAPQHGNAKKSKSLLHTMKKDYTQTMFYKVAFACLSASTIYMTWESLPSVEAWMFISSFTALLLATYLDVINPDE